MEVRSIAHPSADSLKAFGLGKLDDLLAEAVMLHLDDCAECRQHLAAQSGDDFLNRLREAAGRSSKPSATDSVPGGPEKIRGTLSAPATPPPPPDLPPELAQDPNYEILRELGRGGMGIVYQARHRLSGRMEVLKVMNKDLLAHSENKERFRREIQSAASLDHPNVVRMYTASEIGGLMVLVMEYVPGQTLADLVKERGPLPVLNVCYYVRQVAMALQHAFERNMVHRDIKPHNLILAREGKNHIVKVLDFGLAKVKSESESDPGITGTGMVLGTPHYMALEQWLDAAKADIRADIYSLGCTLYYLLAGVMPFDGKSHIEIFQAHQSLEARPLRQLRPAISEELAAIARKMMAKDPAQRFQTPVEIAQSLTPLIKGIAKEPSSKGASTPESAEDRRNLKSTKSGDLSGQKSGKSNADQYSAIAFETLTEGSITSPDSKKRKAPPNPNQPEHKEDPEHEPETRKIKWRFAAVAMVCVLAALAGGLWASGQVKVKTKDGVIELYNLTPNDEVVVDERVITLKLTDGKPLEIRVTAGTKHRLEVTSNGIKVLGQEVELEAGGRKPIEIRLSPNLIPKPILNQANNPSKTTIEAENQPPTRPVPAAPEERLAIVSNDEIWSVEGEELVMKAKSGWENKILFGNPKWSDYTFSYEVMKLDNDHPFGTRSLFRAQDFLTYYLFQYGGYANGEWMDLAWNIDGVFHRGNKEDSTKQGLLCKKIDPVTMNRWYLGHITLKGNEIVCRMNGVKHFSYSDDSFIQGRVGFATSPGRFKFRNIRVVAPDGTVLWDGLPLLPAKKIHATAKVMVPRPSDSNGHLSESADATFSQLLNGKDLHGWKKNPAGEVNWEVNQYGDLQTTCNGRLYTERNDYQDFHLRAEVLAEPNCLGGVFFRSSIGQGRENTYKVQINTMPRKLNYPRSGSIILDIHEPAQERPLRVVDSELIKPDKAFLIEVIAKGNHFTVSIDGKEVASVDDPDRTYSTGYIALLRDGRAAGGELTWGKIEIKEFSPDQNDDKIPGGQRGAIPGSGSSGSGMGLGVPGGGRGLRGG